MHDTATLQSTQCSSHTEPLIPSRDRRDQ